MSSGDEDGGVGRTPKKKKDYEKSRARKTFLNYNKRR